MKLLNLTLDHFKGTKHFSLDLQNGCSAAVYGENGTGKTTLADAWSWLLFGVDFAGQSDSGNGGFQVQTKGTSGLEYSVSAAIEVDGEIHTLRRVYEEQWTRKRGEAQAVKTGNTTSFYLDDVPLKTKKQYDAFVGGLFPSTEIGRTLTNPAFFPSQLKPDARRELLLKLFSPEITEDSVIEKHPELSRLRTYKGYKTVEQYQTWAKAQRSAVNRDLDAIPGRIDEAEKAKREDLPTPEDASLLQKLQAERAKLAMKISAIRSGADILDAARRRSEAEARLSQAKAAYSGKFIRANDSLAVKAQEIRRQIAEKEQEVFLHRRQQEKYKQMSAELSRAMEKLNQEWQEWDQKHFDKSVSICPTCGQPIPPEQQQAAREAFNLARSSRLEQIEQEGTRTKERRKEHVAKAREEELLAQDAEKGLKECNRQLDKLSAAIITPPPFEETEECRTLLEEIQKFQKEEAVLQAGADKKLPPLQEKDATCARQLEEIQRRLLNQEQNQQQEKRIQELLDRQKTLNLELADLDDGLSLAEQFIRLRAMDLEESINSHFEVVRWKLFDIQVNGGVKACCEATADNDNGVFVEYGANLNDGRRIQAGVDIANAVSKATGVTSPIWIDGAGELTRDLHTGQQCIRLYASQEDKKLRVEIIP